MTTDMRFADKTVADMVLMYLAMEKQLAEAKKDAERLKAIEAAARNLVKVKGRFHSEIAMNVLIAVLHGDQAMREGE